MKTALIIGASSGIGLAAARRFAREGWRLFLLARREHLLEQIVSELPGGGGVHSSLAGDYSRPATAEALAAAFRTKGIFHLDALVNCAGLISAAPIDAPDLDQWRRPLDTLLNGAILMTRLAIPYMREGGRIVHVTSIHAFRAENSFAAYGTAKAAIGQYARSAALELADRGILVNVVAPGFIDTPMSSFGGTSELESEWFQRDYVHGRHLPLRRPGRPEEVAGVLHFLCGPDATYITGQTIVVYCGLTISF